MASRSATSRCACGVSTTPRPGAGAGCEVRASMRSTSIPCSCARRRSRRAPPSGPASLTCGARGMLVPTCCAARRLRKALWIRLVERRRSPRRPGSTHQRPRSRGGARLGCRCRASSCPQRHRPEPSNPASRSRRACGRLLDGAPSSFSRRSELEEGARPAAPRPRPCARAPRGSRKRRGGLPPKLERWQPNWVADRVVFSERDGNGKAALLHATAALVLPSYRRTSATPSSKPWPRGAPWW